MRDRTILITGAARSGTSLVAGIIDICGGWGGKMTGATPFNRKGQYENSQIRDGVVKKYLRRIGMDVMGQDPLPDIRRLPPYPDLCRDVDSILCEQGYDGEGIWYYKGAKMCLIWPLWDTAFPGARWIVVRRKAGDIVDSCLRTPFMRKRFGRTAWMDWVLFHEARFGEMKAAGLRYTEIWAEDIVAGKHGAIRKFVEGTEGLEWDQERIDEFVTPELWKGGK